MANRWGKQWKQWEVLFLGLQNHCRWTAAMRLKELAPRMTAMTNLDSLLKSRDITLPAKVHLVKAMVFPVVTYGCESWTIKKAECWRICFWTVVLEKTLESPLDSKEIKSVNPKGNQSWIFIGRLLLKLMLQYSGHLMWKANSLETILMLRRIEGKRRRGQHRMRWLESISCSIHVKLSKLWETAEDRRP